MGDSSGWCTIESDPGVFTELLRSVGVAGVQVEECLMLDYASLAALGAAEHTHGLVFLFHYGGEKPSASSAGSGAQITAAPEGMFFARQVITNACATQAVLSIVLNATSKLDVGPVLREFHAFCVGACLDAETAGLSISNSAPIRDAHNSFAPPVHFSLESNRPKETEDAFHFVAFVPHAGRLYELDGLRPAPVDHGPCGDDWRAVASKVLTARVASFKDGEIRFNLLAVVADVLERAERRVKELVAIDAAEESLREAREDVRAEEARRKRWAKENARRRANFLPFIVRYLTMAEAKQPGLLDAALDKLAKEKQQASAAANGAKAAT